MRLLQLSVIILVQVYSYSYSYLLTSIIHKLVVKLSNHYRTNQYKLSQSGQADEINYQTSGA